MSEKTISKLFDNIMELINQSEYESAEKLITYLEKIDPNVFQLMKAKFLLLFIKKEYYMAIDCLVDKQNEIQIEYDEEVYLKLAKCYEYTNKLIAAANVYRVIINNTKNPKLILDIENKIELMNLQNNDYLKINFFVRVGMDSFINEVIEVLSKKYEVEKILVSDYTDIDQKISDSAINWFEWCDELIAYASKLENASQYTIICRLHSYEAFTDQIRNVNWSNVKKVIFIAQHIRDYVLENSNLDKSKTVVIPNAVDFNKWKFKRRNLGFNIAYVGYINYKKGPMLLLQSIHEIVKKDSRYVLHIAGEFQDPRDVLYFNQMIPILGLKDNVKFHGWIDNLDEWLEDKNYILCTSILESQNMSVMQAMAKGIKPLVHNFVGAKDIYKSDYVWSDINELVQILNEKSYQSYEYRNYLSEKYSLQIVHKELMEFFDDLTKKSVDSEMNAINENSPLVTIGIANYNYSKFIKNCIESILLQTYKNIEIIIVDDKSTDESRQIIESYKNKFNQINTIYHDKNMGTGAIAFQEIINLSRGDYFILLSSDDFLVDKNVVMNFLEAYKRNSNVDYIYGDLNIVDINGKFIESWEYGDFSDQQIVKHTFSKMGSGLIPISVGMHKSSYYKDKNRTWFHDPNNIVSSDVLNSLINIKEGWHYMHLPIKFLNYRKHGENTTFNLKERIKSVTSVIDYITNNFQTDYYMDSHFYNEYKGKIDLYFCYYYLELINQYYENWHPFGETIQIENNDFFKLFEPFISKLKFYLAIIKDKNEYKDHINEIENKLQFLINGGKNVK